MLPRDQEEMARVASAAGLAGSQRQISPAKGRKTTPRCWQQTGEVVTGPVKGGLSRSGERKKAV